MGIYGATCIYVVDSGGAIDMSDLVTVSAPESGARNRITETQTNARATHADLRRRRRAIAAVEEGCDRIDAFRRNGRGRDNVPLEIFIARMKLGWPHGTDLYALADALTTGAWCGSTGTSRRETLALGYAGVCSSFLRHCETAAARWQTGAVGILGEANPNAGWLAARGYDHRRAAGSAVT